MIQNPDEIAQMLSVFHDGDMAAFRPDGLDLIVEIEIPYLTNRIQPGFKFFSVRFLRFRDLSFTTWPKDTGVDPWVLEGTEEVLDVAPEILSAEAEGPIVKVICNQQNPSLPYCGGELRFVADGARITDQASREWSLPDLITLAREYWDDWSKR
jgi:hypothetical protein